jgi:hypothetical protein
MTNGRKYAISWKHAHVADDPDMEYGAPDPGQHRRARTFLCGRGRKKNGGQATLIAGCDAEYVIGDTAYDNDTIRQQIAEMNALPVF